MCLSETEQSKDEGLAPLIELMDLKRTPGWTSTRTVFHEMTSKFRHLKPYFFLASVGCCS